jgi:hypothetical protein
VLTQPVALATTDQLEWLTHNEKSGQLLDQLPICILLSTLQLST